MLIKSAAFALGVKAGYTNSIGSLPDSVFYKIASRTGFDPGEIKQVFLEKTAINWGAMLMGGAAGAGAVAMGKKLAGPGQAANPVNLDPRHKQMVEGATYNQGLSRDLQGAQGAFAAAPNPMGKVGSAFEAFGGTAAASRRFIGKGRENDKDKDKVKLSPASAQKVAGFWGGLAGGAAGMATGNPLLAAGGAMAGSALGDKLSGGPGPAKNPVNLDPYHKRLVNTTTYNQGLSRDLQAARGSFAPAANPFGN